MSDFVVMLGGLIFMLVMWSIGAAAVVLIGLSILDLIGVIQVF